MTMETPMTSDCMELGEVRLLRHPPCLGPPFKGPVLGAVLIVFVKELMQKVDQDLSQTKFPVGHQEDGPLFQSGL